MPLLKEFKCISNGGEKGIRTLDTVARIHAFQACAFNHSATDPFGRFMGNQLSFQEPKPKFIQAVNIANFGTTGYKMKVASPLT